MVEVGRAPRAASSPAARRSGTVALWVTFAVTHAWTALLGVGALRQAAFFDVELYRLWVASGSGYGWWPVFDHDWVYPVGALLPMSALLPWATSPVGYAVAWAVLVTLLDAAAVLALLRGTRSGLAGAWWWVGAALALGPVGMGRLDGLVAPITVMALVWAARRPRVAALLLTVGAWIKVAPGGALLALATAARRPWRDALVPAAVLSALVVGGALVLGAGLRVLGFLGQQDGRGLQVEAVGATPFSLARLWDGGIRAVLNTDLNTFELEGVDTSLVARALDVAMVLAVVALLWLGWRARQVRPAGSPSAAVDVPLLLLMSFALAIALFTFNKVGSPQYMSWLLPAVAVALGVEGWSSRWRAPAVVVVVAAALTQWLFPLDYLGFLWAWPPVVLAEAVRNVLLVWLLAWATVELWEAGRRQAGRR